MNRQEILARLQIVTDAILNLEFGGCDDADYYEARKEQVELTEALRLSEE